MRRFFLPFLIAALWLAAFLGGAAARCDCVRACCQAVAAQPAAEAPHHACCRAKGVEAAAACAKHGKVGCDQCALKAKPKPSALAQVVDVPVFFADAGPALPVPSPGAASGVARALPRAWAWSLPPPDTLFSLGCELRV